MKCSKSEVARKNALHDVENLQMNPLKTKINVGWRERNQQDATNLMFIIKLLSQHVSGIIMPIIRRTRLCTAAYGVLHWLWWLWLCGAGKRAVCTVKITVLLMMSIKMPETCWDKSLIINIRLVASSWFLSLHPTFMMHGHKSLKLKLITLYTRIKVQLLRHRETVCDVTGKKICEICAAK